MLRIKIVTTIILVALKLLSLAKKMHPKYFATFRVLLAERIGSGITPAPADGADICPHCGRLNKVQCGCNEVPRATPRR